MREAAAAWNGLDYTILVIVGLSAVHGTFRGLLRQVFGVMGIVVGALAAWTFHGTVSTMFLDVVPQQPIPGGAVNTIVFILIFGGVAAAVSRVGSLLRKAMNLVALGWLDAVGGAAYGLARGALTALALTTFLAISLEAPSPLVGESAIVTGVAEREISLERWLPESVYEPLSQAFARHRILGSAPLRV